MKKFLLLFIFSVLRVFGQDPHMEWTMESKKVSDCEYDIIFNVEIDKDWHIYSLIKVDGPFPTRFYFDKNPDIELVGKPKETPTHQIFDSAFMVNVRMHENHATFTQRVKLLKPGPIKITGKYEAQVCHDIEGCLFPPATKFKFDVTGTNACTGALASATTTGVTDTAAALTPTTAAVDSSIAGTGTNVSTTPDKKSDDPDAIENMSWWAIFLTGFIGGFAALLTPCVFPMIPMNVSFFTKQSKTKAQGMRNALIYALFIIVLYVGLGLGVTLIFGAGALHTLSTNVWFNLAFFVLLLVFAASFLGAFEIVLPSSFVNKMDSKSDKGGIAGIFFMAFTLALVSFSCTGPIIGTLLVQAAAGGGISGPFWGMFGFALALALPFGLFAAFPGWLNSLPKSGGWLNSVKVVLGFLELALALKFASNADLVIQAGILTREVFIGLWIVIFALQGLYLIGGFKTSHDSDLKHVSVTRLFFAIVSFFITIYLIPGMWGAPLKLFSGILPPLEYSESPHGFGGSHNVAVASAGTADAEFSKYIEVNKNGIVHFKNDYEHALAYAKKTGKPLMVDFTGHACANCRKTEDNIWPDPEVAKRLNNDVVLVSLYVDDKRPLDPKDYMKVQWYGEEREITDIGDKFKYMQETTYGQSTQPLYVILDHNEKPMNPARGYNASTPEYIKWLDEGINKFKANKK
ncbi:MAG: disulfide bond formation protein DsbD [Bacteroidetes bacterium]|nr:disulfide bond formation protein DsbD [Bacteroidota bacterium]